MIYAGPPPEPHWNEKMVMAYLEEAADIHRRLPNVRVLGYHTMWPETMKDDWERLYDMIHGKSRPGSPMPKQVTFSEEIMAWMRWVNRYEQQIIWPRANKIPWKILEGEFGKSKPTLWRDMNSGLIRIASALNARDPDGAYYERLKW